MRQVKNILFVLVDQLRWDCLSCYGHPHLHTPNIDWLAENGVRFERAYVQSPVCGPSRASIMTGRYMSSHGTMSNTDPISIDEKLIGEYLRPLGLRTAVIGKTDHRPDGHSMARYDIEPDSPLGQQIANRAFDPYDKDIGFNPNPLKQHGLQYNEYLKKHGYDGDNPWLEWTMGVVDEEGEVQDGRIWSNSKYPSQLPDEHSETAYVTNRAMEFMTEMGDEAWCLQLGYYKPHWPYVTNAPYHDMYPPETHLPVNRSEDELDSHRYFSAFHSLRLSQVFSIPHARDEIVTAYMGLVKQVDDHFGRLLSFMQERGLMENTMIVFTSDHGDNLGDHWCGEKDIPHDCASRVPLLIYDPSAAVDQSRGNPENRFVELIDLLPTFIDAVGGDLAEHDHLLEGHSLRPLLIGEEEIPWRDYVISEMDFSLRDFGRLLDMPLHKPRAFMIRNDRWKYVVFEADRPMLFDMLNDPQELVDLGEAAEWASVRAELDSLLFRWLRNLKHRTTVNREELSWRYGRKFEDSRGIFIGWWENKDGRNFDP
ncbi:MAG: sulfatase-like hydrolase/transferase, partial [Chloroflexota bacterium]